ncbi:MAG: DUF2798 domain-containing protein [Proteobacteria bacterium]|nr:DUF2798 domain-containing protein [Pseudomonadota bacterium]
MRKIPARFTWLVMPAIMALMMTFVVSGISTFRILGLVPGFVREWMGAWVLSYLIAYPTLLVVLPIVKHAMVAIMEPPKG